MAEELVRRRWCDWCLPERTEATRLWHVGIRESRPGGRQFTPRLLDTCDEHGTLMSTLEDTAFKRGRDPGDTPAAPPEEGPACPVCGLIRGEMVKHLMRAHRIPAITQPRRCPDCRKPASDRQGGMVRHRRAAHGYDLPAEMVARHNEKEAR